ncbi:protein kinase domain-containing protein, partial [Streptomyces cyaneofuscatus]
MEQLTQHDPRRIGPFEVLGRLGAGGMGLVYLARSASGRRVAIKTVRTELAEDQLFRVRFTREVEAARAVSGFYTAAVVDADPRAAVPWLATAYVPAPSLEEIVNECGPMPTQAVRWLAAGIAEALQSIHGAGLVHRDLKPSNVLVVEDGPRVIDFGIASGVSNTRLTMTNVAVGTPAYMSPEQARDSRSVTGASDIFSLGSTLVFAATGHAPYHGANPVETVFMLLREGPDLEGLPDDLRPLIESCMQMDATQRPSPADLQAQLAPHLFASGSDDSGTASAWLPTSATAMIERRRGGGRTAPPAPSAPPPRPPQPPRAPERAPDRVPDRGPGRGPEWRGGNDLRSPSPLSSSPPAPDGGPVHLPGAKAPIGPGPRAGEVRGAAAAHPAAATGWVRPPAGLNGAAGTPTAPVPAVPAPGPAPDTSPAAPDRWRPWRFRMSNDVWGTPVVSGDLLYVTSFEIHALDVGNGRRQFKTRDVAWAMAVEGGRIHASDGPSLYALDAAGGAEQWRVQTDAWVYALKADRGTVLTATRGGGVQGWEASNGDKLWEITGAQSDFETAEAAPVIHDGTVYVWQDARLRALDARTGRAVGEGAGAPDGPGPCAPRPGRSYCADMIRFE